MKKRLKLRIVKLEEAIAVEQQEKYGEFSDSEHVVWENLRLFFSPDKITLVEKDGFKVLGRNFYSNEERDRYVEQFVGWITKEQFGEANGGLKVGEMCDFSDSGERWVRRVYAGRSAPEFGTEQPFLAQSLFDADIFKSWKYARPIGALTIDGEYYTWEI